MHILSVGGYAIEVLDLPATDTDPALPAIVLLHEGLGCVAMWRDFPYALARATGARVIAYSRHGYGKSTPLPVGKRGVRNADFMHVEAEFTHKFLSEFALDRPIVIGHSDGGSIALIFAAMFPASLSALVVMAPHCFVEEISIQSITAAQHAFTTTDLPTKLAKYHTDPAATFYGWNDVWLCAAFRAWNIEALLPNIQCPVLAIQGDADQYGTFAQIDVIKSLCPNASLLKLPDCGHAPWKDQTQATLTAMTHFFAMQVTGP